MAGKVNLSGTGITGTLAVGCGGTGITSVGADGYVLTSNGAGALEYAPPAAGSVTSLADYYVDVANTNNTETDLISYTIPANTLSDVGDKMNVFANVHIDEDLLGAGTFRLRVYFDIDTTPNPDEPIEVFDSNDSAETSNWIQLRIEIIRTGSDTAKISTILSRMENILESAELDEVDFTAGIEFSITGITTTNVANVFKLKQGSITLTKAPGGNVVGSNGIVASGDNTFTANNTFENGVILTELGSDPSTPPSGTVQVYAKNGSAWVMDDAGTPTELGAAGGGSGDTSIISATLPSTSVNNYNPSGFDTATTLLLNLTANSTLTGLVPNDAKTITIQNVSNYTLTLESDSASSSVGNKFMLDSFLSTATLDILAGRSVVMERNGDYWLALYHTSSSGYITHTAHQIFGSTCGITVSTDGVTITGDGSGGSPLTAVGGGGDVTAAGDNTFTGNNTFDTGGTTITNLLLAMSGSTTVCSDMTFTYGLPIISENATEPGSVTSGSIALFNDGEVLKYKKSNNEIVAIDGYSATYEDFTEGSTITASFENGSVYKPTGTFMADWQATLPNASEVTAGKWLRIVNTSDYILTIVAGNAAADDIRVGGSATGSTYIIGANNSVELTCNGVDAWYVANRSYNFTGSGGITINSICGSDVVITGTVYGDVYTDQENTLTNTNTFTQTLHATQTTTESIIADGTIWANTVTACYINATGTVTADMGLTVSGGTITFFSGVGAGQCIAISEPATDANENVSTLTAAEHNALAAKYNDLATKFDTLRAYLVDRGDVANPA